MAMGHAHDPHGRHGCRKAAPVAAANKPAGAAALIQEQCTCRLLLEEQSLVKVRQEQELLVAKLTDSSTGAAFS
jgi:hypothetical protein